MFGEEQKTMPSTEERLRKTEKLLLGIVNATKSLLIISDYDLAINQAIATLGKATEVDCVRIFQVLYPETNRPTLKQCFAWFKEVAAGEEENSFFNSFPLLEHGFERWYEQLRNGNSLKGAVSRFPARERDNPFLAGVKSLLACPIIIKGEFWGFILYQNWHSEQVWEEQEEAVLMTVAVGLGAVIDRQRAEEALGSAYEELEQQVYQRTKELAYANQALHQQIKEKIRAEERLRYLGEHDSLTGLYNRAYFQEEMQKLENSAPAVGIIICDVDGLKLVNDFLGHDAGDELLISAAELLKMCFREDDCVARIGGDEFAVLLKDSPANMLERAIQRIKVAIARYNKVGNGLPLSLSVGGAARKDYSQTVFGLLKEADNMMYKEKVQSAPRVRCSIARAMMQKLRERDLFQEGYEFRLEKMVANLAIAAGMPEEHINDMVLLAQFHNYGKVMVPVEVMLKGRELTREEREQVRNHCESGQRLIRMVPELSRQAEWIYKHHEWWNGQGLPGGIAGESIPVEARILAICDLYDVLTNEKYNRQPLEHQEALKLIQDYSGTRFDPMIVQKFIAIAD